MTKYYTLVHYSYARTKEGSRRYTRINGKIPLWNSYGAARGWRDANFGQRAHVGQFVAPVELLKLRKDHMLMEAMGNDAVFST